MLSSQNTGKYLTGTWHKDRERALQNVDAFTPADQTFLEMDGTQLGPNGHLKRFDSTMNIGTHPIDPQDMKRKNYDWRENPEVSG
jgi:hypothetical protein